MASLLHPLVVLEPEASGTCDRTNGQSPKPAFLGLTRGCRRKWMLGAFDAIAALRQTPVVLEGVLDGMLEGHRPPLFQRLRLLLGSRGPGAAYLGEDVQEVRVMHHRVQVTRRQAPSRRWAPMNGLA